MAISNHLLEQALREIEALSKTSQTAAGEAEPTYKASDGLIDALNEVFALFRIKYHNQYYKAESDSSVLAQLKKLGLESLVRFEPD
ncbi:hypothetical protein Q4563_21085, partial [Gilvimarinus sp. 1_MG-2023]|nr:hypothetical protein [Gilvimarinus sp. 1_MG-2023]